MDEGENDVRISSVSIAFVRWGTTSGDHCENGVRSGFA